MKETTIATHLRGSSSRLSVGAWIEGGSRWKTRGKLEEGPARRKSEAKPSMLVSADGTNQEQGDRVPWLEKGSTASAQLSRKMTLGIIVEAGRGDESVESRAMDRGIRSPKNPTVLKLFEEDFPPKSAVVAA
ncbi:hypothetical protein KM043_008252 [Ampulex compressa]|nr:hypothetical protein KM043_008252 [Ampulex compressa]